MLIMDAKACRGQNINLNKWSRQDFRKKQDKKKKQTKEKLPRKGE